MQTLTCVLCNAIIPPTLLIGGGRIPSLGEPGRELAEFAAGLQPFFAHVANEHPEYVEALVGTANLYHMQLVAKLATSTEPDYEATRENMRRLLYWTLAARFGVEPAKQENDPVSPTPAADN